MSALKRPHTGFPRTAPWQTLSPPVWKEGHRPPSRISSRHQSVLLLRFGRLNSANRRTPVAPNTMGTVLPNEEKLRCCFRPLAWYGIIPTHAGNTTIFKSNSRSVELQVAISHCGIEKNRIVVKPFSRVLCNIGQIVDVNKPSTIANRHSAPQSDRGRTLCCNRQAMNYIQLN